jgi:hypothetical protein
MDTIKIADIPTGAIACTSSDTTVSEAIQWFEDCKWSHALTFIRVNGILYVIEADGTNVWGRNGVFIWQLREVASHVTARHI